MTPANDTGEEARPITPTLAAVRSVDSLLTAARDLMLDAEGAARDGGLKHIARWLHDQIAELDGFLMKEVRAAIDALEAEARQ